MHLLGHKLHLYGFLKYAQGMSSCNSGNLGGNKEVWNLPKPTHSFSKIMIISSSISIIFSDSIQKEVENALRKNFIPDNPLLEGKHWYFYHIPHIPHILVIIAWAERISQRLLAN